MEVFRLRKMAAWVFAFVLLVSLALPTGTTFASTNTLKLVVDGVEVEGYEQPFVSNEQVLIPVENVFNEAGFKVTNGEKGKVSVTNTYLTVDFDAAANKIDVNGKKANTVFPLTLQNAGNYISTDFLSQLEGFEVAVSEDNKTVNVTTNRVKDVDALLEKMLVAELKSYSANMKIDQKMESSTEELGLMNMLLEINMDVVEEPMAMHMLMKMAMDFDGESMEELSESYLTKDGFFQKDGTINAWVKYDDELTEGLFDASIAQADPLAQLELMKKFMTGVNIYEYEDIYVMTQTLTNDEFKEMMDEAMSLIEDLIPGLVTGEDSIAVEVTVENEKVEAVEEEKATEETDATEEADEEAFEEIDFGSILEELNLDIKEFYISSKIDKKTLFPLDMTGTTYMTMGMDDETMTIKQIISGTFSNFNSVKEIKVPAEVIKNAISMEEYFEKLGIDFDEYLDIEEEVKVAPAA